MSDAFINNLSTLNDEKCFAQGIDSGVITQLLQAKVVVPQRAQKKELVELAIKNARVALEEKFKLIERQEERTVGACDELGQAMNIYPPLHIEAFDNSHMHGADAVSAMVVFIDGKPDRKAYRNLSYEIQQP